MSKKLDEAYLEALDKIADLEAKLAEKDKEIEELNDKLEWKSKWLKIADNMVGHYEKSKQDKISFCIEQLKWVEKLLLDNAFNDLSVVLEEIDNQIEELKKGENNE